MNMNKTTSCSNASSLLSTKTPRMAKFLLLACVCSSIGNPAVFSMEEERKVHTSSHIFVSLASTLQDAHSAEGCR